LRYSCLCLAPLSLLVLSAWANTAFDSKPWLEDLEQVRVAFATQYPDLEWEVFERDLDLSSMFARARDQVSAATSDAAAKAALVALTQQFGDRHVQISWKTGGSPTKVAGGSLSCAALGYSTSMQAAPLAALIPGATALRGWQSDTFPIAMLRSHGRSIAILKIKLFMPQGFPQHCETAIHQLSLDATKPCDEDCAERISAAASAQMTTDFAQALRSVRAAGADVLLIDLTGNVGGSEWSEAAARMVTPIRLESTPMYFMKGDHWARRLATKEQQVRTAAAAATGADRQFLLELADVVAARKRDAQTPCDGTPLWSGQHPSCTWLGDGFYSTGLLRSGETRELRGKSWAPLVFTPLQYPYQEGIWRGPLLVVVNGDTDLPQSSLPRNFRITTPP